MINLVPEMLATGSRQMQRALQKLTGDVKKAGFNLHD
jgi:hypothetical protein